MPHFDHSWQSLLYIGILLLPVYFSLYPIFNKLTPLPSRGAVLFLYAYPYIATLLFLYGYLFAACYLGRIRTAEQYNTSYVVFMMVYSPLMVATNAITRFYLKKYSLNSLRASKRH